MAESKDARDFLLVALFTGMRRNEIATLKWEHVDLIGCTLTVPKTKNGDPLVLPLSDYLVDLIAQRRETVGQSEWVFPGPGATGHIVETKSFTRRVSEPPAWTSRCTICVAPLSRWPRALTFPSTPSSGSLITGLTATSREAIS